MVRKGHAHLWIVEVYHRLCVWITISGKWHSLVSKNSYITSLARFKYACPYVKIHCQYVFQYLLKIEYIGVILYTLILPLILFCRMFVGCTGHYDSVERRLAMVKSSTGNIFRVPGPLSGEFTGSGEYPEKGQWRRALMFSLICAWITVE